MTGSTNVGEQLPTGQLSVVPWRRTGVKYTNNEAYFDVVEEIDAIIDKSGTALCTEHEDHVLQNVKDNHVVASPFLCFLLLIVVLRLLPLNQSGSTITAEIQGVIDACVKLTGMPDLTLSFMVSSIQSPGFSVSKTQ